MEHPYFLAVSYVVGFTLCCALGVGTYYWLRGSFREILAEIPEDVRRRTLGRFFPFNMIIPGVFAFMTVSYYGCGRTYQQIVTDRRFMVERNTLQLQHAAEWLIVALLFWGVITGVALIARRSALATAERERRQAAQPDL